MRFTMFEGSRLVGPFSCSASCANVLPWASHGMGLSRRQTRSAIKALTVAVVLALASELCFSQECTRVNRVCAESATDGSCIRWENTYRCLKPTGDDGVCQRTATTHGCVSTAPVCTQKQNGVCVKKEIPVVCTKPVSDVHFTHPTFETVEHVTTTADRDAPSKANGCELVSSTCLNSDARELPYDNAPKASDTVKGVCWDRQEVYHCQRSPDGSDVADAPACQTLVAAGCQLVEGLHCIEGSDSECLAWGATYRCDKPQTGDGLTPGEIIEGEPEITFSEWDRSACEALEEHFTDQHYTCQKTVTCERKEQGACVEERVALTCTRERPGNCEALDRLRAIAQCQSYAELASRVDWTLRPAFERDVNDILVCVGKLKPTDAAFPPMPALPSLTDEQPAFLKEDHTLTNWRLDGGNLSLLSPTPVVGLACDAGERRCTEGPAWRLVDGEWQWRACWEETVTHTCFGGTEDPSGDCEQVCKNPACTLVKRTCPKDDPQCPQPTEIYRCQKPAETIELGTRCDGQDCVGDLCRDVVSVTDNELPNAIVQLELARQLSTYGDVTNDQFFGGQVLRCRDRKGASSCCHSDARAETSNAAFGQALLFSVQALGEAIKFVGSPYVYDAFAWSPKTEGLLKRLYGDAPNGAYSPTFSYWGLTATYSASSGWSFGFSPVSFMATAAMGAYGKWAACTAEDAKVAVAKGQGLCHYVGEVCAKRTPGLGCTERQQVYVCFNSRLSKIINEEGRRQLGIGWGQPNKPIGRGLTMDEINRLDFNDMDFSDFMRDVLANITATTDGTVDPTEAARRAAERLQAMIRGEISRLAPTRRPTGARPTAATPHHPQGNSRK